LGSVYSDVVWWREWNGESPKSLKKDIWWNGGGGDPFENGPGDQSCSMAGHRMIIISLVAFFIDGDLNLHTLRSPSVAAFQRVA